MAMENQTGGRAGTSITNNQSAKAANQAQAIYACVAGQQTAKTTNALLN